MNPSAEFPRIAVMVILAFDYEGQPIDECHLRMSDLVGNLSIADAVGQAMKDLLERERRLMN